MATSLAQPSGIDVLEEAVQLLREAPLSTWVCHWMGAAPFALGLVIFWSRMTGIRATDTTCMLGSLALAVLLVWMNSWRAVFAGRLVGQLSGSQDTPWTAGRMARLITGQAFFGGTKLVALPLAVLIMIPSAWTTAFYRNTAVVAGSEDLDTLEVIAKARRLARYDQRQNWIALLVVSYLYILILLNAAATLAFLPQLMRILTGYESAYSRSGWYFLVNGTFWVTAFTLSWMAIDPLVQALYCVRCFRGVSLETGEDLRSALARVSVVGRTPWSAADAPVGLTVGSVKSGSRGTRADQGVRPTATAVVLLAILALAPVARAQVAPEDLDRSIHRTLQSREYDWRLTQGAERTGGASWFVTLTDRLVEKARALFRAVGNAIDRLIKWLQEIFPFRGKLNPAPLPGTALHWSVYLMIAATVALIAVLLWRRRSRKDQAAVQAGLSAVNIADENLRADQLPEEGWFQMAENFLGAGDFRSALRALYLANLAWLGQRQLIAIHSGKTNHEYETELRRKARALADVPALFAVNVAVFERAWYGMHDVSGDDAGEFRERLERMKMAERQARGLSPLQA